MAIRSAWPPIMAQMKSFAVSCATISPSTRSPPKRRPWRIFISISCKLANRPRTNLCKMFYLQLRGELWKLFGKKRTYIGFTMFLLAQNVIVFVCRFTHVLRRMTETLANNGFDAEEYISVLTISTVMMVLMAY